MRILFSVVVPTFDRPAQLAACLEALAAQTFPAARFEVIVVDDGGRQSLDGIANAFAGRLQIKLLRQPNGGCASARQLGIDHAEGEYLAFTDDDCRPAPDWLTRIETALKRAPGCAVAGRTINGAVHDLYAEATQSIVETVIASGRDAAGYVRYAPTSNLAFPTVSYVAMGGLDRSWRIAGGEDRDLCARWREAGFRLSYESSAKVFHYHHLTLRGFLRQHFHYGRGAWRYYTGPTPLLRFESLRLYPNLLLAPFREQPIGRAMVVCGLVLLAQFAAGAGLMVEALGRGDGVARKPARAEDSAVVRTNPARRGR